MLKSHVFLRAAAAVSLVWAAAPATAALKIADFTGGVLFPTGVGNVFYGMNRNSAPFNLAGGSVVFDDAAIPGAGSGFVNVAIPVSNANAFSFFAGTQLVRTLGDLQPGAIAAIQYNNGIFNGIVFTSDINISGTTYTLDISGGTWQLRNASFQTFASGFINIGANGLTNVRPYSVGPAPIPEPASWAMMIAGFALAGTTLRVRARRIATA